MMINPPMAKSHDLMIMSKYMDNGHGEGHIACDIYLYVVNTQRMELERGYLYVVNT